MEAGRRGPAARLATLAGCVLIVGASACGGSDDASTVVDPGAVRTANPERTFAPLVEVAANELWRPMSARWFIERSVFWFAEDDGCADRKIAVGHTLPGQRDSVTDWIFPKGLGGWSWPAYYRNPYDATCEDNFDLRFHADQLTRPHDPGLRVDGIRPGEGFYLDLVDAARGGPAVDGGLDESVYAERVNEGDGGVRLTYWMLFGMHGVPGRPGTHEGDWERVHVLLQDVGDDRYQPDVVQAEGARLRDSAWATTRRVEGMHPVVRLAPGTHSVTVSRLGESCGDCVPWETWRSLAAVRKEPWYGFGGAWGGVGDTDATTGPLGPYRVFR